MELRGKLNTRIFSTLWWLNLRQCCGQRKQICFLEFLQLLPHTTNLLEKAFLQLKTVPSTVSWVISTATFSVMHLGVMPSFWCLQSFHVSWLFSLKFRHIRISGIHKTIALSSWIFSSLHVLFFLVLFPSQTPGRSALYSVSSLIE